MAFKIYFLDLSLVIVGKSCILGSKRIFKNLVTIVQNLSAKSLKFWNKNLKIIKFKNGFLWIFYLQNVAKVDLNPYLRHLGKKY